MAKAACLPSVILRQAHDWTVHSVISQIFRIFAGNLILPVRTLAGRKCSAFEPMRQNPECKDEILDFSSFPAGLTNAAHADETFVKIQRVSGNQVAVVPDAANDGGGAMRGGGDDAAEPHNSTNHLDRLSCHEDHVGDARAADV
jgi:hypothetical protein